MEIWCDLLIRVDNGLILELRPGFQRELKNNNLGIHPMGFCVPWADIILLWRINSWTLVWISLSNDNWLGRLFVFLFHLIFFPFPPKKLECPRQNLFKFSEFCNIPPFTFWVSRTLYHIGTPWSLYQTGPGFCDSNQKWSPWIGSRIRPGKPSQVESEKLSLIE